MDDRLRAGSDRQLAGLQGNLAVALYVRFGRTGDISDLDAAIAAARQALAANLWDSHRVGILSELGSFLLVRFERTGDSKDLDEAIDVQRQALAFFSHDHAGRALCLSRLGRSLATRYRQTRQIADLGAALDYLKEASHVPTGTPSVRLAAARQWGAEAAAAGLIHEAAAGYAAAVGLLPEVAWHGLNRATREEHLAQWAGLAADAAARAVLDGQPERGVELLEQGRSVLWTQALNLRSDLTRLREKYPDPAARLDRIRDVLDSPGPEEAALGTVSAAGSARTSQDMAELRRRAARDWDFALAQVRKLEGFEYFLATIPYPHLAGTARDGPVVVVNASHYGCHALIVDARSKRARVVSLPGLSWDTAVARVNQMLRVLTADAEPGLTSRQRLRNDVFDVLGWLWDVIAHPVLAALGCTSTPKPNSRWPRVWWCPTGPLTALPIHAAGHYSQEKTAVRTTDSVLDRVISSYTPTLTALSRSRQPMAAATARQLTVGMPTTPGLSSLPAVSLELEVLARQFPLGQANHQLVEPQATRANVATAIGDHTWVHLACHAAQEPANPDRSGFVLWDGILTISDLAAQPTQHRDLAFLSACQTAAGGVRHLDEAIHLAAAMQFLGYRHVIATMWTIADSPAPRIAEIVYTTLNAKGRPDTSLAAEALHYAIRSLRNAVPMEPLVWAPYVHFGA